jgi:lysophospholipase L1-like esterase
MTSSATRHKRIWKWITVCYVIALQLFSVILVFETDFIPKFKAIFLATAETAILPPDPHVRRMLTYTEWMDKSVPDKSIIFLGDSITQGLAVAAVAPYATNFGIGGATTAELLDAMPSYKSLNRVDTVVLEIGINDLIQNRKEGLHERYRKIAASLPLKTTLIWSAVMPTGIKHINPTVIVEANRMIKTLCETRDNCIFVDTWSFLADESGQPIPKNFLADATHLSPSGYRLWISAIKQAMLKSANGQIGGS